MTPEGRLDRIETTIEKQNQQIEKQNAGIEKSAFSERRFVCRRRITLDSGTLQVPQRSEDLTGSIKPGESCRFCVAARRVNSFCLVMSPCLHQPF